MESIAFVEFFEVYGFFQSSLNCFQLGIHRAQFKFKTWHPFGLRCSRSPAQKGWGIRSHRGDTRPIGCLEKPGFLVHLTALSVGMLN